MSMSTDEINALVSEIAAGTYTLTTAEKNIATAAKGADVRKAIYALPMLLANSGIVGCVDTQARTEIENLLGSGLSGDSIKGTHDTVTIGTGDVTEILSLKELPSTIKYFVVATAYNTAGTEVSLFINSSSTFGGSILASGRNSVCCITTAITELHLFARATTEAECTVFLRYIELGNSEVTDIRVGYDDTPYETAGKAVRSQVSTLSGRIEACTEESSNLIKLTDASASPSNVKYSAVRTSGLLTITEDCTCSGDTAPVIGDSITLEANTVYTLSGCVEGGSVDTFYIGLKNSSNTIIRSDYGDGLTFYNSSEIVVRPCLRVKSGCALTAGMTFKPMLCKGDTRDFISGMRQAVDSDLRYKLDHSHDVNGGWVNSVLKCAETYIDAWNSDNSCLEYSDVTPFHNRTGRKEEEEERDKKFNGTGIDCSTLVWIAMLGVPYAESMYAYYEDTTGAKIYKPENTPVYPHENSIVPRDDYNYVSEFDCGWTAQEIASYYKSQGIGFTPRDDGTDILPGDILFFAIKTDEAEINFDGINHVEMLLARQRSFGEVSTLTTINCSGGRDGESPVQVNNRTKADFWWLTEKDDSGKVVRWVKNRIIYVVRPTMPKIVSENNYDYAPGNHMYRVSLSLTVPHYECASIRFRGTLHDVGDHFTININGKSVLTTPNITKYEVDKEIEYTYTIGNKFTDIDTATAFMIYGYNSTGSSSGSGAYCTDAIIRDACVIDGVFY